MSSPLISCAAFQLEGRVNFPPVHSTLSSSRFSLAPAALDEAPQHSRPDEVDAAAPAASSTIAEAIQPKSSESVATVPSPSAQSRSDQPYVLPPSTPLAAHSPVVPVPVPDAPLPTDDESDVRGSATATPAQLFPALDGSGLVRIPSDDLRAKVGHSL